MERRTFLHAAAVLGAGLAVPGRGAAGPVTRDELGDQVQTVPTGQLPAFAGPPDVRAAYRYAAEHGPELTYIPCYCGCGRFGHRDNRACYVKASGGGTVTFTSHAAT